MAKHLDHGRCVVGFTTGFANAAGLRRVTRCITVAIEGVYVVTALAYKLSVQ